jgi:aminopeptidase N
MKRLSLICLALAIASCEKDKHLPEKGVSLALNDFRKQSISNISYDLVFEIPDRKADPIEGKVTVNFTLSDDSQPVIFDYKGNEVKGVWSGSNAIDYENDNEHIAIAAKKGNNSITIEFIAGDLSLNRNETFLYTLFVPDRASTCFPLFDQPNLKAVYDLTLRVPKNWKAVSNGELRAAKAGEYSFGSTKPISSYLFAFAAGEFKSVSKNVSGRDMTMYYRENDSVKVRKNADEIFRLHGEALKWLEDYTSIPYPFGKFDFALIPSFQYGGMEHPGSIFYNESSLFLDDNASINRKMGRASLIAHETAHMWFGDLVTMDWFNDVWMKEVFANFMAAKIVQPSFPGIDHDLRFLLAHYPAAYSVDRTKGANPIIQPLDNLKNAGTMYGAIIYQKAPIVMRHLENMIGQDTMKVSLREYLNAFSYKNAVWDDLVKIIDKRSPEDIAQWSKAWVYTAGMPVYDMKEGEPFKTFDYGYCRVPKDTKSEFFINYEKWTSPATRAAMLINTWEAMLRGDGPPPGGMLTDLYGTLQVEKDPLITDLLLGYLETLWWTFLTEETRGINPDVEELLWSFVVQTKDKGMQSSYFRTFRSMATTQESLFKLEGVWSDKLKVPGLTLSEEDKIAVACELALKVDTTFVLKQIEQTKNPDRVERLKFVTPALSHKEKVRDSFFESLKNEENREHEAWVLEALGYLHHPLREKSSEKYLLPSLELLQEIQLTGDIFFPQRWLNTTFDGHSTKSAVDIYKKFLAGHPAYPAYLANKILQAADMTERAAALKGDDLLPR